VDEQRANSRYLYEYREACAMAFSATCLSEAVPDSEVTPDRFTIISLDRDGEVIGKEHRGGVCVLINDRWCKTTIVRKEKNALLI
jgi:hypothetical protein